MTKSLPKLVLNSSRDIPFAQLVLSQRNVRRMRERHPLTRIAVRKAA